MPRFSSTSSIKIYQFVFSLFLLAFMYSAVRSMMFGARSSVNLLVSAIIAMAVILALDDKYWVLCAFLFGFYDSIPMSRFTGAELGSLILIASCFARRTMHKDVAASGVKPLVYAAMPFMIWMGVVWSQNPTGMKILGSSSYGGRFYFKVILAFLALCFLSTMSLGERDCRLFCLATFLGNLAFAFRLYIFGGGMDIFESASTHYQFIRLSFVAPLFLSRFTAPELLASRLPLIGFLLCFGLSVYSGNRTAGMRPVMAGVLAPFLLRRDRGKTIGLILCASVILAVIVAGHGSVWRLPFAIQRSLSFLPGKWDRRLESYGFNDIFRANLRYVARQHIRANPWFGDGGFAINAESLRWAVFSGGGPNALAEGHALGRNWHNVWLGMAADFGIPMSVAWGIFIVSLLVSGYRRCMRMPPRSWRQTTCLYFYLLILVDTVGFFFGGGHTSMTAQQFFLWTGMMLAASNEATSHEPTLETRAVEQFRTA